MNWRELKNEAVLLMIRELSNLYAYGMKPIGRQSH